jgi:hypothetical protein
MKKVLQITLCVALGATTTALAQQTADSSSTTPAGNAVAEDHHLLTGVHDLTLGSPEGDRNVLTPSLSVMQEADSNAFNSSSTVGWAPVTMFGGSLGLEHSGKRDSVQLQYGGNGALYETNSSLNTYWHNLGFNNELSMGRASLLLSDSFNYSRQATFGANYAPFAATSNTDLNAGLLPNQSVLTPLAGRIGNTAAAEIDYHLSREDSITASFTQSMLHFLDGSYLNSNQLGFQSGYNRQIRHHTIGLSYGFQQWTFETNPLEGRSHTAQFSYGYRITSRLAFQASAGPQIVDYNLNLPEQVGLSSSVALHYHMRASDVDVTYNRGLSGGAGVLATAKTDSVAGNLTRRISRRWNGAFSAGYGRSSAISGLQAFNLIGATSLYNTITVGAVLTHDISTDKQLVFSYQVQDQATGTFTAPGAPPFHLVRHLIGAGFTWHIRPIHLR